MTTKEGAYEDLIIVEHEIRKVIKKVKSMKEISLKSSSLINFLDKSIDESNKIRSFIVESRKKGNLNIENIRNKTIRQKIKHYSDLILSLDLPNEIESKIIKLRDFETYTKSSIRDKIVLSEIRRLASLDRKKIIETFKDRIYMIRFNSFFKNSV